MFDVCHDDKCMNTSQGCDSDWRLVGILCGMGIMVNEVGKFTMQNVFDLISVTCRRSGGILFCVVFIMLGEANVEIIITGCGS